MNILIIEDNKGDFILLHELLKESRLIADTVLAPSLHEAIEHIQTKSFDVVLLDMGLPDSAGTDTIRKVRSTSNDFSIVVITGNQDEETGIEAVKQGADDYLVKGEFNAMLLERTIRYSIERHKNARELRESEELLDLFINAATDGFVLFDEKMNILKANHTTLKSWNATDKSVKGKHIFSVQPYLKGTTRYEKYLEVIRTGEPFKIDELNYVENGEEKYFKINAFKVGSGLGLTFADITREMQAEKMLKKANEIIQRSKAAIFRWKNQEDFPLEFVSENIEKICGYTAREFRIGVADWIGITNPDDTPRLKQELYQHSLEQKDEFVLEYRIFSKSGDVVWIHDHTKAIRNDEGKITHYDSVVIDITARKNAEEQLSIKNKLLSEANATKDKFFSIIAHDLRSPFNSLLGFLDVLNNDYDNFTDQDKKRFIRIMHSSAHITYSLLENLLEWSRSQRGYLKYKPDYLMCRFLADEVLEQLKYQIEDKQLIIANDIPSEQKAYADFEMSCTILRNLLSNAVKFSNRSGKIVLSGNTHGNVTTISIRDYGIGMDQSTLEKLFLIDKKVSRTGTENEKGSGLGLILCKELAEKNFGKIEVESKPGKGSTFVLKLPLNKTNAKDQV